MILNTPQPQFWQHPGRHLLIGALVATALMVGTAAHAACTLEKLDPQVANGSKNPTLRNSSGCVLNYNINAGSTISVTLADITSPSVAKHAFLQYQAVSLSTPLVRGVADISASAGAGKFGVSPTAGDISSTGNGWRQRPDYMNLGANISNSVIDRIKLYNDTASPAPVSATIELYK